MSRISQRLLAGLLLALGTSGCIVVPHRAMRIKGVVVPETAVAAIQPGTSTREDVLHLLGLPEQVEENGRYFIYQWTMSTAMLVVATAYGYSGNIMAADIPTEKNFLCMEFSPEGKLLRCERLRDTTLFRSDKKMVAPWMQSSATPKPGGAP